MHARRSPGPTDRSGAPHGPGTGLRAPWRRRRAEAERVRMPGLAQGAQAGPGGGVIRFARSSLLVRAYAGGGVFLAWDGAGPEPSYALAGPVPEPDGRAELEPDKDGGWRVVSSRLLVKVSRRGAVEVRTPGGVLLRRDLSPRWWEPAAGPHGGDADAPMAGPRWMQRSEVAADGRFFGLGGRAAGGAGRYRLWHGGSGGRGAGEERSLTMPVLLTVADAGTHLVFHDNTWDGTVSLREGTEGGGSGHDRPGRCELRVSGGPLRYWVITGPPARVLRGWAALTGAAALPPSWALGYQHAPRPSASPEEVRRAAEGHLRHELPLRALHMEPGADGAPPVRPDGARAVAVTGPRMPDRQGGAEDGRAAGVFVRDGRGRVVRRSGAVFPDFTDPRARRWWAGREADGGGWSGMWLESPLPGAGGREFPLSARYALEGRGGDHREGHNVYALTMARAAREQLREVPPGERPFLFSRAGWAGVQRYGGACPGEVETGWEGMRSALSLALGAGLSGVPYAGSDVGGCTGVPSAELYVRWFQMAAYLPLLRTSSLPGGGREPWAHGPSVLRHCAAALAERERLMPYWVTLAQLAHRTGAPYVRPVWWQHPRDRALRECGDAFVLGDALLVAPVLEEGARSRRVVLPRGRWYDTASGEVYEGPGTVRVAAPLSRIPVLARAGAAVPVRGADGATELEVWPPAPGRTGSGLVIPDDGREDPRAARFTVRLQRGGPVVARESGGPVEYPVRVRGGGGTARR